MSSILCATRMPSAHVLGYNAKSSARRVSVRPCLAPALRASPSKPASRRGPPVKVQALAFMPGLVPMVARALTAGVLFYASMNWVFYRNTRKDIEKGLDEFEKKESDRRSKIDKLTSGKMTDSDNKKN